MNKRKSRPKSDKEQTQMRERLGLQLMEQFDSYLLVGYTADEHRRVVDVNFGRDPSCQDGLQVLHVAAQRWLEGNLFPRSEGK